MPEFRHCRDLWLPAERSCRWTVGKGVYSNWHHPHLANIPRFPSSDLSERLIIFVGRGRFHSGSALLLFTLAKEASPNRGNEKISLSGLWGCCLSSLLFLSKTTDGSHFLLGCHYQPPSLPSNYKCPTSLVFLGSLRCCQFYMAGAEGGSREQHFGRHLSSSSLEIGLKNPQFFNSTGLTSTIGISFF